MCELDRTFVVSTYIRAPTGVKRLKVGWENKYFCS